MKKIKRIGGSVSIDLDNVWTYLRAREDARWLAKPCMLNLVVPRIVDFFSSLNIRPTIFVVGSDLETPAGESAVREFDKAGFEIGNHSYSHAIDFHQLGESETRDEITQTNQLIASYTKNFPVGFRGPSFQMSAKIDSILSELNFMYDASSYPTSIGSLARLYHFRSSKISATQKKNQSYLFGNISNAFLPLKPYRRILDTGSHIIEIPVSTLPVFRLPIHLTYINYLGDLSETLAQTYFSAAARLLHETRTPPSLLLHAADFIGSDDNVSLDFLPGMKRKSSLKMATIKSIFRTYNKYFDVTGIRRYIENYGASL